MLAKVPTPSAVKNPVLIWVMGNGVAPGTKRVPCEVRAICPSTGLLTVNCMENGVTELLLASVSPDRVWNV